MYSRLYSMAKEVAVSVTASGVGVYAEDLHVGSSWPLGEYRVTSAAIIAFASEWDPQFFHIDEDRARAEGPLGGLIASGLQTISIYQRLDVLSRKEQWHVIGGDGIDDARLRRPVRPGDVLTGRTTVSGLTLQPERRRGRITLQGELTNQNSEVVMTITLSAYLQMRP